MSRNTRAIIEKAVEEQRGLTFTALREETGLSNGVLQYHIRKSDKITRERGAILPKSACRECELQDVCRDRCMHTIMRKDVKRRILELMERGFSQNEIARYLDLDKSTVSYHVSYLKEHGLLDEDKELAEGVAAKLF